ncbi:MAG: DUF2304 domain-containing protein [Lachnospiraceae bacterium]|nr:DUF2304 domain-containing protein [Lachnospiraceae bacterium]
MTLQIQIILIVFIVLFLLVILNMIRKRELELKYALSWFIMDLALIILVCIPNTMEKLAELLGIYSPVNMVFFLGFVFSLIVIFVLTVTLSRMSSRVRRLAQIVAMMNEYHGDENTENAIDDSKEDMEG